MNIFNIKWWKLSWKNWKTGGPLLPPPPPPKIITIFDWDIKKNITTRELATLTLESPRMFKDTKHFKTWYSKLPKNVKRHIKPLV